MPIEAAPTAPTIRESLEAAVATVVPDEAPAPIDKVDDATIAASETVAQKNEPALEGETEAQKAERLRNKDGTFAKGKPEAAAPVAQQPKPKVPRPTSWKKDLEGHWDTLPPEIQAYVNEREKQYATGVSTYKTEADRAKDVMAAVNQFTPMLEKMNIPPAHWIKSLGAAHHFLSNGTPQERVQTVADIIRNNRVDAQALFQVLTGQQPQYQQQGAATPLPQAQQQPVDIDAKVNEALSKRDVENAYKAFTAEVDAGKYPHFADDAVKGTMAQLLDSGLAQDYPSAYATALALPKHSHLAVAATAAPAPVSAPVEQKQAQAARARSQAVSVRSSTPSTMTQASGPKGLRDTLSENFDKATTSRV